MLVLHSTVLLSSALRVFAAHHHHSGQHVFDQEQEIFGMEKMAGKRVAVIGMFLELFLGVWIWWRWKRYAEVGV
jgi:hypothetical protein